MKRSRSRPYRLAPTLAAGLSAMLAACAPLPQAGAPSGAGGTAQTSENGAASLQAAHDVRNIETLVFVRHGEKPPEGLGQLSCKGLNRALALPAVIAARYGKPDAIYAPNPAEQKDDNGHPYYYVRPLATIEPTAIQFGMPIQTPYGYSQTDALQTTLVAPQWRGRTVLVAWEHREIEALVRRVVVEHGGQANDVPRWESADFDSIYVVRIDWTGNTARARFSHEREGLDGRADDCPCAQLPEAQ